jgi:hypothetical protein
MTMDTTMQPMTVEHDGRTYRIEARYHWNTDTWAAYVDGKRADGPSPLASSRSQAAALSVALDHILLSSDPAEDDELPY